MTPTILRNRYATAADWVTQQWIRLTGKQVSLAEYPWLNGPVGKPTGIGNLVFDELAAEQGLVVLRGPGIRGLVSDLARLTGPEFESGDVNSQVRAFYEQTSQYEIEAWSQWHGGFRPFGLLLAWLFSRRLQQLNLPITPLDTSRGLTSEVLQLIDPGTNEVRFTAWVRHLRQTGDVLYAGTYGITSVPGHSGPCLQVVFPLPTGNAIAILKPTVDAKGVMTVTSEGRRFGDPGFYFTVHREGGRIWARYLRTMQEGIRVYQEGSDIRADHTMRLWRRVFMQIHYRMRRREDPDSG